MRLLRLRSVPIMPLCQLFDLGLQFLPRLHHRQRHFYQQLPVPNHLELLVGLALYSLIGFPRLSFQKDFPTSAFRFCKQGVGGSNPPTSTNQFSTFVTSQLRLRRARHPRYNLAHILECRAVIVCLRSAREDFHVESLVGDRQRKRIGPQHR